MKKLTEGYLGFEISEEEFKQSRERAEKKLCSIVERFGNCDGLRQEPEYLAQLIAEDVKAQAFMNATILVAINVLNMEKEHSVKTGALLVTDHIVAQNTK